MAILNSIRKRGVFLIVIIAMALFSFVLADVIRNGGFGTDKAQTTVATVNGIDVPRTQFMEDVESYQRALGPNGTQTQAMNVVANIDPIANLFSCAINWQFLASQSLDDGQWNQLLRKLIGSKVVRAVRDQHRQAVSRVPGPNQVIGPCLRGGIG